MPNCSMQANQKVVHFTTKDIVYFQFRRLHLFQKALAGILFEDMIPADLSKIEKNPGRPKNLDSKDEKHLIILPQNDPKENSTQLLWHLNPKQCCSTRNVSKKSAER